MSSLVNPQPLIAAARRGGYAVPMFNVYNLEWAKAILLAANDTRAPVMLGFSHEAALYFGGYRTACATVRALLADLQIVVPVALHLDHGTPAAVRLAIDHGFTSVMFDGSKLPLSENVLLSTGFLAECRQKGICFECEVGTIGGKEDAVAANVTLATVEDCLAMAALKPDALAAGIGNVHGSYPPGWKGLDLALLARIDAAVRPLPLVLHGGSYIPDEQVRAALKDGVARVNFSSELRDAFARATVAYCAAGKAIGKGTDPRRLLAPGYEAMKKVVAAKIGLVGANGKA